MKGALLSIGEQICKDFNQYLRELEYEGRCVFLPFQIEKLKVRNIGKFTERTLEFDRGLSVVYGLVGTGKTTVVKSIASISGYSRLVKCGEDNGEIKMTLSDGRLLHQSLDEVRNVHCIVVDDVGEQLDENHYEKFLCYLRDMNTQLILTTGRMNDERYEKIIHMFPDCRFIDLNGR